MDNSTDQYNGHHRNGKIQTKAEKRQEAHTAGCMEAYFRVKGQLLESASKVRFAGRKGAHEDT